MVERLGRQLIDRGLIDEAQLATALERQRVRGGRIGDNVVELGFISANDLAALLKPFPRAPLALKDSGLDGMFVAELAIKHASLLREFTVPDLAERLKLPQSMVDDVLELLHRQKYVDIKGSADYSRLKYRYAVTSHGTGRAEELMGVCRYVGPAPVSIEAYRAMIRQQTVRHILVDEASVRRAFANLIVRDELLRKIGPAVSAGRAIFVYGPPGNGKTAIAETIGSILPGTVYIPHAVLVGGQIITIFDSVNHTAVPPEEDKGTVDDRWALCKRPIVLAGGELTLKMLDLVFNTSTKFYEAPVHLKAQNGLFIIDDFGRQHVHPRDLLNRWIVPLERRTDFLGLHTGMKFEIPFDQLVVFSTNLPPEGLVDEAFLRRIRYKIKIDRPSREEFEAIFRKVCQSNAIEFHPDVFAHLIHDYYEKQGVELNSCHPRDIIDHIIDDAHYGRHSPAMTREAIASAWEVYFMRA